MAKRKVTEQYCKNEQVDEIKIEKSPDGITRFIKYGIEDNGNCGYHAFARWMHENRSQEYNKLTENTTGDDPLRQVLHQYIKSIASDQDEKKRIEAKCEVLLDVHKMAEVAGKRLTEKPNAWMDWDELFFLCCHYGVKAYVYYLRRKEWQIINPRQVEGVENTIHLYFTGTHYDLLVPIPPEDEEKKREGETIKYDSFQQKKDGTLEVKELTVRLSKTIKDRMMRQNTAEGVNLPSRDWASSQMYMLTEAYFQKVHQMYVRIVALERKNNTDIWTGKWPIDLKKQMQTRDNRTVTPFYVFLDKRSEDHFNYFRPIYDKVDFPIIDSDSKKRKREDTTEEQLAEQFMPRKVDGDGYCFYHAVVKALWGGYDLSKVTNFPKFPRHGRALREKMRAKWKVYWPEGDMGDCGGTGTQSFMKQKSLLRF